MAASDHSGWCSGPVRPPLARNCTQSMHTSTAAPPRSLVVWSRSVGESAKLIPHSGRDYGPGTSRLRHDHARRPNCDTAIEGSAQGTSGARGLNHKTVAKWRKQAFVNDAPMGPKTPQSTVLSSKEKAIIVA